MFGQLRDKLAGFVNKLIKREEDKPVPAQAPPAGAPVSSPPKKTDEKKPEARAEKKPEPRIEKKEEKKIEEKKHEPRVEKKEEKKIEHKKPESHSEKKVEKENERRKEEKKAQARKEEKRAEERRAEIEAERRSEEKKSREPARAEKKAEEKKPEPTAEFSKPEPSASHPEPAASPPKHSFAPVPEHGHEAPAPKMEFEKPIDITPPPSLLPEPEQIKPAPAPEPAPVKSTYPASAAAHQKPEQKKNILSSIWPFAKKEEKKKEEARPVPKPIVPVMAKTEEPALAEPARAIAAPEPVAASKPAEIIPPIAHPKPAALTQPAPESSDLQVQEVDTALDDEDLARLEKKAMSDEEREMKVKMGISKSMLGFLSNQVTIEEGDVRDLLDELELALLESDVAIEVSTEVTQRLRTTLVGMKVDKNKMQEEVARQMKSVLASVMTSATSFDFLERVQSKPKPVKILFVGPNGAGKTTTMAKIAHLLMQAKLSVVFAAGDTFRAAAIEQTEVHAQRLGVPVVKSKYGADPASVAFDAVNYAKAHQVDVVLIDSAGRQDTNVNLLDELKKINRVVSPDIKIYIGESIGGHALMEQVRAFHSVIGIDGAILTKLDCDAKGGTALSLTHATGVPILFLGIGQEYGDLEKFDADKVAGQILT